MPTNNVFADFFSNIQIELSEEYITSSTTTAVIVGIIAAVCIIASAFLMKKNRALGIVAGIFEVVGVYCAQKMAHLFMDLELFRVVTGSNQSEVNDKLADFYADSFKQMLPYMFCSFLVLAAWVITLVFIIKSMKVRPKLFPVFALILHIIRYLCVSPIPFVNALFGEITEDVLRSVDLLNYAAAILPFALLLIGVIIFAAKSKKSADASEK